MRDFLQGLVTNDVVAVEEGAPRWAALLTPQGKALFDFMLWADGDDILIDCEASEAETLARRLTLYRLRRAISIAREDELAVHWAAHDGRGVPDPRLPALGHRWLAAPGDAANRWLPHRLSHGVTEGVGELGSDKTLWLEANARELNGVSFTKGCYVGQENTARMHHRSKVNRRLIVVRTWADPGEGARIWYPDLGLAVAHLRVEALSEAMSIGEPILPDWLQSTL